jgi:chromosome partitioning protein
MPFPFRTIATINFKGGVGKTTATWCLANTAISGLGGPALLVDLDAQMSLTQAVALKEDGTLTPFGDWLEDSSKKKRTLFDAVESYTAPHRGPHFNFPVKGDFIYHPPGKGLGFIPSSEQFYWFELEVFQREHMKHFIRDLLGKIANAGLNPYKYVFFDCPPNFSVLSYSTLATCDMILIPVNPDFYASRGLKLILQHLKLRIEPFPLPTIAAFMNKAGYRAGQGLFRETRRYMDVCKDVCGEWRSQGAHVYWLESFVRDRVDIKRAIHYGGWAGAYGTDFVDLFEEMKILL